MEMEKDYLPKEQYDAIVSQYRERYNYDEMDPDERAEFDRKLDAVIGVEGSESSESTGDCDDSQEQTEGTDETEDAETPDQPVLRLRRIR